MRVLILICILMSLTCSASNDTCGLKKLTQALNSKQLEQLRTSDEVVESNAFIVNRSIEQFREDFGEHLDKHLLELKSQGKKIVWYDWGAGTAKVQRDSKKLLQLDDETELIAISYKKPTRGDNSEDVKEADNFPENELTEMEQAIASNEIDYLERDTNEKIDFSGRPKANIATDFYGALSYAKDLTTALKNVFDNLETNGEVFIFCDRYRTTISNGDSRLSLAEFLKTIPGLEVAYTGGIYEGYSFKVIKKNSAIKIPTLKIIGWHSSHIPPERHFEVVN